jgi:hypothetical protein
MMMIASGETHVPEAGHGAPAFVVAEEKGDYNGAS